MVEEARLESVLASKALRGFESHLLRKIYSFVILVMMTYQSNSSPFEHAEITADSTRFESVYLLGLQGNIHDALHLLDSLDNTKLTKKQSRLKQRYYSRFRDMDEKYDLKTNDVQIIELMKIYRGYWQKVLNDNSLLTKNDSLLTNQVIGFLKANYKTINNKTDDDLHENFTECLRAYLLSKGIHAATGKTGIFFDLLMHSKESEVIYDVTTPEDTLKVKVVFMEDILSNGWEDYATFGKYYPGGWATTDALYCLKESYDLNSEKFLVSYLKHEGKHFADYKSFPKLTGADLEYRAKLVELSSAKTSLYELIKFFTNNSIYDR